MRDSSGNAFLVKNRKKLIQTFLFNEYRLKHMMQQQQQQQGKNEIFVCEINAFLCLEEIIVMKHNIHQRE